MEFLVSRTSGGVEAIDGVYEKECIRVDERTVNDPKKLPVGLDRNLWYERGTNHRVEDGHIKRDFSTKEWFIDLPDLDALIGFTEKYGEVIIGVWYQNTSIKHLEVYDDYRE